MTLPAQRIATLLNAFLLLSLVSITHLEAKSTFSANGKIAFTSDRDGNSEIYLMNADGTGQARLTNSPDREDYPTWSPDGRKIAFVKQNESGSFIYLMDSDGSDQTQLTAFEIASDQAYPYERFSMSWSPDEEKIDFNVASYPDVVSQIYSANKDGSGLTQLTNNSPNNFHPAWQPLPVVTVSGRVLTPDNRGLRSAAVTLTDSGGVARTLMTSSLGFYNFDGVTVGNYTISVSSRRFRFSARTLEINDSLAGLDFMGLE